ncbi:homocysteine S-methyltransferase [Thermobispora bispora]|uniref:S-methylmethionine:homocysteine methyltransferase n=1 Tax=Thermobispora bispora (strain ATCC 19993 / DSM 43833 / CBS 139.67 / JCM 10125 / KCTC 9307 / NBRC 14880 / R51) TaxID=469371 RepID=D6Y9B4_THEBD|nr:homocysteine S-methyltransferase [Thermobispora bispora]ADG88034.1 homocysteine S-methyltransferase [Thermobispora bispora DSM 43833]MBO2474185.1 homocysteine S-methyltransferase [Actinomycetales bacterium]MBX6167678.1 homocysteine S-methyltransferase [Thermobispora bispora]MDI9580548.1 homocysteine S-methyltransferase [Thermobispora sp.]
MSYLVLDGGLATHLEALGCDLRDELWSARLLIENPGIIRKAHLDYFAAGADVATTASYQASIPGFVRRGLTPGEARDLLRLAVRLAVEARDEAGHGLVAASVGPYGAYLANGAEYTGAYDLGEDGLFAWHRERFEILASAGADLVAFETIPSFPEACAVARLLRLAPEVRAWVSFSCRDDRHINDGTPFAECVALFSGMPQVVAVGVNCTPPRHIPGLIRAGARIVYPNSGEAWDPVGRRWTGTSDPVSFGRAAVEWRALGATHIGGCCRTTPAHIREIRARLAESPA